MSVLLKGLVVGITVTAIGLLAERGKTSWAAILVYLPVFSLGAFWAASGVGVATLQATSGKVLLGLPVWLAWIGTVYALSRWSSLPTWGILLAGLAVWAAGTVLFLRLVP